MSGVTILPKFRRPWLFFVCVVAFGIAYFAADAYRLDRGPYSEAVVKMAEDAETMRSGAPERQLGLLPIRSIVPFLFFLFLVVPSLAMATIASPVVVYALFSAGQGVRTRWLRILLTCAVGTVPFVIAAGQFEHELYPLFFAFALSNYFLLEFYRRDYAFYLFGFGLSFAFMYLVRPETVFFAVPVCIGFLAIFGANRQTWTYLYVALFPLIFAVAIRFAVQLILGREGGLVLDAHWSAANVGPRAAIGALVAGPYALLLAIITLREGRYAEFYRSPIFFALLSPLIFVAVLIVFSVELPVQACAALFILNLALVFPHLATIVPEKRLRWPVSAMLVLSIAVNAYVVVYRFTYWAG